MADYSIETEGSAIAAFALAQVALWAAIESPQARKTAVEMLRLMARDDPSNSPANSKAAGMLQKVLAMVEKRDRPQPN